MLPRETDSKFLYSISGYHYYNENGNHMMYHSPTEQTFVLKYTFDGTKVPTRKKFEEVVKLWKVWN
jgi:hypothetical protein